MIHAGPSSPGRGKFRSGVTGLIIPAKTATNMLHMRAMQHDLSDRLQDDTAEMETEFLTVCDADRSAFP